MLRPPMTTPQQEGFSQPAEWTPHAACWVAWPSDESLWLENLPAARAGWVQMARAIASGETLEVLVPDVEAERAARTVLHPVDARFHRIPFGDIWLRDTAPIFVRNPSCHMTRRSPRASPAPAACASSRRISSSRAVPSTSTEREPA
jgi:agmatine/peptidylarginine deiminase